MIQLEKFFPSAVLAPFIKELLVIECGDTAADSRTIPDTHVVMAFRFKGNVWYAGDTGREALPPLLISGLRRSSRSFHYTAGTGNLIVILKEAGMAAFTGMPAHELYGQSVSPENFFSASELEEVSDRLAAAADNRSRITVVEAFLQGKLIAGRSDLLIDHAVKIIRQQGGVLRIKELAQALHISQDPFEKRFRARVGATPKQYASIIRLRRLVGNIAAYPSLTKAAYDAGYFDQSHFIKDFRLFTGLTPRDFLKDPRFW